MAKDKDEDVLVHPDPGGLLRQRTDLGIESALAFLEQVSNLVALIRNEENLSFACPVLNQPASAQLSDCACPLRLRARVPTLGEVPAICLYAYALHGLKAHYDSLTIVTCLNQEFARSRAELWSGGRCNMSVSG